MSTCSSLQQSTQNAPCGHSFRVDLDHCSYSPQALESAPMLRSLHALRCQARLYALLGILSLCLQLVATGVGSLHAAERLAHSTAGVIEICTAAGIIRITADGTEYPGADNAGQHCPFCTASSLPPPLLAVALSFFLPLPGAADFLPAAATGAPSAAPDQRHAPNRAPPFFFA